MLPVETREIKCPIISDRVGGASEQASLKPLPPPPLLVPQLRAQLSTSAYILRNH